MIHVRSCRSSTPRRRDGSAVRLGRPLFLRAARPDYGAEPADAAGHDAELRVEGREADDAGGPRREPEGTGVEDEDLGEPGADAAAAPALPEDLVGRLRIDLSVWRGG